MPRHGRAWHVTRVLNYWLESCRKSGKAFGSQGYNLLWQFACDQARLVSRVLMALLVQLVADGLQWGSSWVLATMLAQHPTHPSLQAVFNKLGKQGHEHCAGCGNLSHSVA